MRALPAATREHLLPVGYAAAAAPGAGTHRLSLLDAAPLASRRRGGAPQQTPPSSFELAGDRGQRNPRRALSGSSAEAAQPERPDRAPSNVRGAQQGASDEHKDPPRPQEPFALLRQPLLEGAAIRGLP